MNGAWLELMLDATSKNGPPEIRVDEGKGKQRLALPAGVRTSPLDMHSDGRGVFTELFRASWDVHLRPVQWNVVQSAPGVLRGVHVHPVHHDYLVLLSGRATVGLHDLRPGSPTLGLGVTLELSVDPDHGRDHPIGCGARFLLPRAFAPHLRRIPLLGPR